MSETNLFNYKFKHLIQNNTRKDGWINATKWCKYFGKRVGNFTRLDETKAFMEALSQKTNSHVSQNRGRSGLWFHPLLAIKLAEWLSSEFEVFVKETFKRYLEGDTTLATEIIERSTDHDAVRKHNQRTKLHENYLVTYHGVHDELKAHNCESKHHAGYNTRINKAVGIPNGTRQEMTLDQKKEMMFRQLAGEYALKADPNSSQWHAVNKAVNAGNKALEPYKR